MQNANKKYRKKHSEYRTDKSENAHDSPHQVDKVAKMRLSIGEKK